jgi:hypothetical protein
MVTLLDPGTIAHLITDRTTREAALEALEMQAGAHEVSLALAAAPALTDVLCLDKAEVGHALFQRVGLLRARLVAEAADPGVMFGTAHCDGRWAAYFAAPNVVTKALEGPPHELDATAVTSYVCGHAAVEAAMAACGWTKAMAAAMGLGNVQDWLGIRDRVSSKCDCITSVSPLTGSRGVTNCHTAAGRMRCRTGLCVECLH